MTFIQIKMKEDFLNLLLEGSTDILIIFTDILTLGLL